MEIKIKKIAEDVKAPNFAKEGDAGLDMYSNEEVLLKPGDIHAVATGVCMEIPHGFVGLVWDKSGLALKSGVKTMGGVIDSGYRGEVKIIIKNLSNEILNIEKGQKVAQMLIQKVENPEIKIVEELSETERGHQGFGSTGIK